LAITFLYGTKMEAVAYDDQTMRFDGLLVQGQEYDVFIRVGFLPTWVDDMRYMFSLYSDFYVYLSTHYGKCTIEYFRDSSNSSYAYGILGYIYSRRVHFCTKLYLICIYLKIT